jgi:hypothetical protein
MFAAVIAFLQWKASCEKIRLDLFDRRYALYKSIRGCIEAYLNGNPRPGEVTVFIFETSTAEFLLPNTFTTPLEELKHIMIKLDRFGRSANQSEFNEAMRTRERLKEVNQLIEKLFLPLLDFRNVK